MRQSSGSLKIRDSIIGGNNSYGVYVVEGPAVPNLGTSTDPGNNTFQDNGGYDLRNDTEYTVPAFGNTWDTGTYGPTMVVLSSFAAMVEDGKVILVWRT